MSCHELPDLYELFVLTHQALDTCHIICSFVLCSINALTSPFVVGDCLDLNVGSLLVLSSNVPSFGIVGRHHQDLVNTKSRQGVD